MAYRLPPQEIVEALDAPAEPLALPSPDGAALLLVEYEPYPPIALLARPFLKLGGIRVDPALGAQRRTSRLTGLIVVPVDGVPVRIRLPAGAVIGMPVWSFDSRRLAFTRDVEDGVELWVADATDGAARALAGVRVNDVLAGQAVRDTTVAPLLGEVAAPPFAWLPGSRELLVRLVPADRGAPPQPPLVPEGPRIQETAGKRSQVATYQDLLTDATDEARFEHFGRSQLARVDVESGAVTPVGPPALLQAVRPSPDGRYLLVNLIQRPFSFRVPYPLFARRTEVWDRDGGRVFEVASLPVSDEVPPQGVPLGPRAAAWQETQEPGQTGATLLWVEALDGGDPRAEVSPRDQVMTIAAPFAGEPRELLRVAQRFAGWEWLPRGGEALLTEFDPNRRWRTTALLDPAEPRESRRVLFDLSVNDAYHDPGSPIHHTDLQGRRTLLQDGSSIYLAGAGAGESGDRPFLDRFDLETRTTERLFRCDEGVYERFVAFAGSRARIITRRESPVDPPNYYVLDLASGARRRLTGFADPHPALSGVRKELIRYERADGVPLSGLLCLPPGWTSSMGRLPVLLWAYPLDYSDPATAGQVRGSANTYTQLAGASPLWFLARGFAVLFNATMPVVGDPNTMNDTFVEQIVAAAAAAIEMLEARGVANRRRVVAAGHSYGAFMTANLLAHSDLFAAGIARSGAYNRTL
ncbi:MAG TPA: prolyl oligopeptidase family serine peptidase, partial [Dehalococcoidia bacterium]|nr:prolyl oligopeptidase family serine peptidase [Dehalococcoidia bacterium]